MFEFIGGKFLDILISTLFSKATDSRKQTKESQKIKQMIGLQLEANRIYFEELSHENEIDYQGLKDFLCGGGLELICRTILSTNIHERERAKESLLEQAYHHARSLSTNAKETIKRSIERIISILLAVYEEGMSDQERIIIAKLQDSIRDATEMSFEQTRRLLSVNSVDQKDSLPATELELQNIPIIDDYIARYVVSCNVNLLFTNEWNPGTQNGKTLIDICNEKQHIVLLGEAGSGKTTELQHLYHSAIDAGYFPLYVQLRNFPRDETLRMFWQGISNVRLFLILDGFDEVDNKEINTLIQQINGAKERLKSIPIVVSSRWNFYRLRQQSEGVLNGFSVYFLAEINGQDINDYANSKHLNYSRFRTEIERCDLAPLCRNPFYLTQLVVEFNKKGFLSDRASIMEEFIRNRFNHDAIKFSLSITLDQHELEIFSALKKVAFITQYLMRGYITNSEYQQLMKESERSLLIHSGIWQQNNDQQWQFEHNSFREYLVAMFICDYPLDELLAHIASPYDKASIKNSWLNVFSYLVLIRKNDDLREWTKEKCPELALKFDASRFNLEERGQLLISILEKHTRDYTWLGRTSYDFRDYAEFGACLASLDYMITSLEKRVHHRAMINALNVMISFRVLYLQDEKISACIKSICQDINLSNIVKKYAVNVLTAHDLFSDETTDWVISLYQKCDDEDINQSVLNYLTRSKQCDRYIRNIIDIANKTLKGRLRGIDIKLALLQAFTSVTTMESINILLIFYKDNLYNYNSNLPPFGEVFPSLCKLAICIYKSDGKEIFDIMVNIFCCNELVFDHKIRQVMLEFFRETNTQNLLMKHGLLIYEDQHVPLFLEMILNESLSDDLYDQYLNSQLPLPSWFNNYACRMNGREPWFGKYSDVFQEKNKRELIPNNYLEYEQNRKIAQQRYFDSLFNKDVYEDNLSQLAAAYRNPGMTFKQLNHYKDGDPSLSLEQDYVLNAIYFYKDRFPELPIVELFSNEMWLLFSHREILGWLEKEDNPILISQTQSDSIQHYCSSILEKNNFLESISVDENSFQFTESVYTVLRLISLLKLQCTQEQLINMLLVPPVLLTTESKDDSFPDYIIERLPDDIVRDCVLENIRTKPLYGDVALSHIKYCENHRLRDAMKFAEGICNRSNRAHMVFRALQYLTLFMDTESLIGCFLPTENGILLEALSSYAIKSASKVFEECLVALHQKSNDEQWLLFLIKMNSKYAIDWYSEKAQKMNALPDYKTSPQISEVTEAIRLINRIELLPELTNLLRLSCATDFMDKEAFGLRNSVHNAFINISRTDLSHQVELALLNLKKSESCNYMLQISCASLLEDIRDIYKQTDEQPWDLFTIKQYLNESL